jgi:hypothetical protein
VSQVNQIPTVYCFRPYFTPVSGYGMAVYRGDNSLAFSTSGRALIPRGAFDTNVAYSNLAGRFWSLNGSRGYMSNGPSETVEYVTSTPSISTVGIIAKPAIGYYGQMTGLMNRKDMGTYYFFESGARLNISSGQLETQWGQSGTVGLDRTYYGRQVPAHNTFTLVIDGAMYD